MTITIFSPHRPQLQCYKRDRIERGLGHHQSGGGRELLRMASTSPKNLTTANHLRHVDSMASPPSGAGNISHLNAVILGEALASEEDDLVLPSDDFSRQALVPSPQKVSSHFLLIYLIH